MWITTQDKKTTINSRQIVAISVESRLCEEERYVIFITCVGDMTFRYGEYKLSFDAEKEKDRLVNELHREWEMEHNL